MNRRGYKAGILDVKYDLVDGKLVFADTALTLRTIANNKIFASKHCLYNYFGI